LFALSLSLQGQTLSPTLLPDFSQLDWSAFSDVFRQEPNLTRWIVNSFVVALAVTLGQLITCALAAYALATMNFPAKTFFFFFFLGTLMIPWESTIIPNYLTVTRLGWKDSYPGLIAPFLAGGFGIFLLRQYFLTIPRDLYEAAVLDGCGYGRYLWSILLPLSRPGRVHVSQYLEPVLLAAADRRQPAVAHDPDRYHCVQVIRGFGIQPPDGQHDNRYAANPDSPCAGAATAGARIDGGRTEGLRRGNDARSGLFH
jgi:hypothetical protein